MFNKNKSLKISAPREKELYGVKIRKLPIAKYIRVLRTAEDLPQLLLGKAFPGQSADEMINYLKHLDKDKLLELLTRLITVVPEEAMKLLSELLDIPQERLLDDTPDALSPAELLEIVEEFWKINDMTAFFVNARRLAGQARTANTGYNAG